jgi:hypothetical protein
METDTTLIQQGIWHSTVQEFTRTTRKVTLLIELRMLISEKRRDKWQSTQYPSEKCLFYWVTGNREWLYHDATLTVAIEFKKRRFTR